MNEGYVAGIDFTCAPSKRKPITLAIGRVDRDAIVVECLQAIGSLDAFAAWLTEPRAWVTAFDFPFGLPRAFVDANALGSTCTAVIASVRERCPTRMAWRAFIDDWGNTQPAGSRLLHRRTDAASAVSSTSPLQSRYVPVAFMYYEGLVRVVASGAHVPGLVEGDRRRVALEGYPRRLAHAMIGNRSYKNSALADRRQAREAIVDGLTNGHPSVNLTLRMDAVMANALLDDVSGDHLDAVLCLAQAARASRQPHFGMPAAVDAVEGWIVGD